MLPFYILGGVVVLCAAVTIATIATVAQFAANTNKLLTDGLAKIIHGQRLSSVLEFRGSELLVNPGQFEPNKERLLTRLHQEVGEYDHPQPSTWAYCVLNQSGVMAFLNDKSRGKIQEGFARLRANGDIDGMHALAEDIMKQL